MTAEVRELGALPWYRDPWAAALGMLAAVAAAGGTGFAGVVVLGWPPIAVSLLAGAAASLVVLAFVLGHVAGGAR